MDDRAASALIAIRRIASAAETSLRALARATGLGFTQLIVLQVVSEAGEITPKMIARRAGLAPASVTALVERLAQHGFVERSRSVTDRRMYWVSITDAGRAALEAAPDPLRERLDGAFAEIPPWEQAMILAGLERVAGLLEDPAATARATRPAKARGAAADLPAPDAHGSGTRSRLLSG